MFRITSLKFTSLFFYSITIVIILVGCQNRTGEESNLSNGDSLKNLNDSTIYNFVTNVLKIKIEKREIDNALMSGTVKSIDYSENYRKKPNPDFVQYLRRRRSAEDKPEIIEKGPHFLSFSWASPHFEFSITLTRFGILISDRQFDYSPFEEFSLLDLQNNNFTQSSNLSKLNWSDPAIDTLSFIGTWVGNFGKKRIDFHIIERNFKKIKGYSVVGKNNVQFEGEVIKENNMIRIIAREPNNSRNDGYNGIFKIQTSVNEFFDLGLIKGNWSSYNGNLSRDFVIANKKVDKKSYVKHDAKKTRKVVNEKNNFNSKNDNSNGDLVPNQKSLGEIRGLIIMSKRNTVLNLLGEPNKQMSGSDYSKKILNYKLGYFHDNRLMNYWVWIYSRSGNSGNNLLVVFDRNNLVCKVIYASSVKQPYDLIE